MSTVTFKKYLNCNNVTSNVSRQSQIHCIRNREDLNATLQPLRWWTRPQKRFAERLRITSSEFYQTTNAPAPISMMTSPNGNIFRVTGHLCGESPVPGEFPTQRPVTRSFDVFFDLRLNKRLSKQSWGWWFETLSCPLWRHRNASPGAAKLCRNPYPTPKTRSTNKILLDFILGWAFITMMSLERRGSQIDGASTVCSTVVFG